MWLHLLTMQRSLSLRPCSQLAQHRDAASQPVPWTKRINKQTTQKLISRAKTLAHASAPIAAGSEDVRPNVGLTSRLMTVPQIQQPQELFNSAMKPVRKLKPRTDLRTDQEVASNLVCSPVTTYIFYNRQTSTQFVPMSSETDKGCKDYGYTH